MPELPGLDLGRLAWALVLSFLLWTVVQAEINPDRVDTIEIPIEPRNVPTDLVVTNRGDWRNVQARISAPRGIIGDLRESQFRAYVDLSQARRTVEERPEEFPVQIVPPDEQVRVIEYTPRRLPVRLEELTSRSVPVRVRLEGNPAFGHRAGRPEVVPATVRVGGPAGFVSSIESAEVEVRLDNATSDINSQFPVALIDTQGGRQTIQGVPRGDIAPPQVQVVVPITQQFGYKEVGVRPQTRGNVPAGYWVQSVSVDPPVVPLVGDATSLAAVNAVDTEPVDLSGATASFTQSVNIQVPAGLAMVRAEQAQVTVEVAAVALTQTLRVPVSVVNVENDLFVASEVPIVDVNVSGTAAQGLSPADVQARADAAGLGPGLHPLEVRVQVPAGFTVQAVQPATVNIALQSVGAPTPTAVPPTSTPAPVPTATMAPIELPLTTPTATRTPSPALNLTTTRVPATASTPSRTPTRSPTVTRSATPTPTPTRASGQ